jgi:exonuclease III
MPLQLASWNVAGWEATLKYIREHYGTLDAFLDRHQLDILCLQEVKVTKAKLSEDAKAHAAHSARAQPRPSGQPHARDAHIERCTRRVQGAAHVTA